MNKKTLSCLILFCFIFSLVAVYADSVVATPLPVREWKLDETAGDTAYDTSGQGKDGTRMGGAKWIQGMKGNALQFFGTTDYVKVPTTMHGGLGTWAFTAYVKPETGTEEICIYSEKAPDLGEEEGGCYFYISITTDNRIKVVTWNSLRDGHWDTWESIANVIKRGEWNHLHLTLAGGAEVASTGELNCYVNRVLVDGGHLGSAFLSRGVVGAAYTVGTPELTRLADGLRKTAGDDFDSIFPWSEIRTVTAPEGSNMIKIPKFYYKRTYDAGERNIHQMFVTEKPMVGFKIHPAFVRNGIIKPYIYVAPNVSEKGQTRAQCRETAQAKGDGWGIVDIQTWSAIQMLQLIEYANTTGSSDYRGITGLYASPGQFIDGINLNGGEVYIAESNFADNTFEGQYQSTGFEVPASGTSISNWHYSEGYDWLFLPKEAGDGIPSGFKGGSGETVAVAGMVVIGCNCRIYCNSCQIGQHGYCGNGCSCACNCRTGPNGYGCLYRQHNMCLSRNCGRSVFAAPGLFDWDLAGLLRPGARLLYIP